MEIDNRKILTAVVAITLLLFLIVAFTSGPLRIVLGVLFLLFFPGYTLLSALFPKRRDLSGIERLALSFGISVALVPLIGLVLNYTPWGIKLYPILVCVTLFIVVTAATGWYRQRQLTVADRFSVTFKVGLPRWEAMTKLDKALSLSLTVAILAATASLGYVIAIPKESEKFSEFFILNTEGKAENYPREARLGEPVDIVIGVVNHEYEPASYQVTITIDGIENKKVYIGTLAHEEKWEKRISFILHKAGQKKRVEFQLYKNDEKEPYFEDPLGLFIDVTEP